MFTKLMTWLLHPKAFWGRALISVIGGVFLALSFPSFNFWPGIFIGYFLILISIRNVGFFKGLILGNLAGFAYFGVVTKWLTTYLGPIPWFALSLLQAVMFGLASAIAAVIWRWLSGLELKGIKPFVIAMALGAVFTGREYLAGIFPFDGLPWARGGLALVDTWLAKWVYYLDIAGLTWLIVFVSASVVLHLSRHKPSVSSFRLRVKAFIPTGIAVLFVALVPALTVLDASGTAGTIKVGAVQGNANAGLFAVNPPGSILDKHLVVSKQLAQSERGNDLDLIVWPENASDLDPNTMVEPSKKISDFVTNEANAPLLFGTKTFRGSDFYNEVDLWLPKTGLSDFYHKKRPVPFGEYVPNRPFYMALAPDLIGLIGWDMSAGKRDGIFELPSGVKVGSLICFEVAIDYLSIDLVNGGAQAIMVQTNSSDFGKSEQGAQQAAISRMRAIETGRSVVSISTVGVSGIYAPDGSVMSELEPFKPGFMVEEIALRDELTPAVVFGKYVEPSAAAMSMAMFFLSIASLTRRRFKARLS
jgi:apolipoprotein N-acyltransferase